MKKQLLTLSLSTALSTALLTTFLPTTILHASNASCSSDSGIVLEDESAKVNPLLVKSHVGIDIDKTTLPSNDQFVIHSDTLHALEKHLTLTVVYFENDQAHFTFNLATEDTEAELITTLKDGKILSESEKVVINALVKPLETWVKMRNDFVKRYFQYRADARDVTLLSAVNKRYNNRKMSILGRPEPLDTALDGTCVLTMNQIIGQTQKDASESTILITSDFKTKGNILLIALAAATLPSGKYSVEVKSMVDGNRLKQIAFEGTHDGLIFTNEEFSSLIANLCSGDHQLPTSDNKAYQSLVGAEAVLAMAMYQSFLVDPDDVNDLFALNADALVVEQKAFAESAIRNERSHKLLATDLVPVELLRAQDRKLAGVEFTDDEADAYGDAGGDHDKKAAIVKRAKARILKEGRDAARHATGVAELTDREADDWNYYDFYKNQYKKDQVVETAKARLLHIEEEKAAALLLQRTQARETAEVAFTDEEADNYIKAEVDDKPGIVELAKARIAQELEDLDNLRKATRLELKIKDLSDEDIDLYIATEGIEEKKEVLKIALERIVAESQ